MIRLAEINDLEQIVAIYNQAIATGFQTAFTEQVTVAGRLAWYDEHTAPAYPLFVCELDGEVAGWLSISPYRSGRAALRRSVEISYFVHQGHHRKGIAGRLLQHALTACKALQYKTIIAIIIDHNAASVQLVERAGFAQWGHLPAVADFGGVVCGHLYYGIQL